jgi:hypothetical protein
MKKRTPRDRGSGSAVGAEDDREAVSMLDLSAPFKVTLASMLDVSAPFKVNRGRYGRRSTLIWREGRVVLVV